MDPRDQAFLDKVDALGDGVELRDAAPLNEVRAADDALTAARTRLDDAVRAARQAGFSWGLIGYELGVSKQAAQRRFAPGRRPDGLATAPPKRIAKKRLAKEMPAKQVAAKKSAPGHRSTPVAS